MENESQAIFDKNVVEFVTVTAEFCAFLERCNQSDSAHFVDTTLKILPLLYLKALLLPPIEPLGDEPLESYVTEASYEHLRTQIAALMGEKDDYLDVFVEEMTYSDQPIKRNISEELADIYQDLRDFIYVFQLGLNETMHDALALCQAGFQERWGQKLVNTLRALHDARFGNEDNSLSFHETDDY